MNGQGARCGTSDRIRVLSNAIINATPRLVYVSFSTWNHITSVLFAGNKVLSMFLRGKVFIMRIIGLDYTSIQNRRMERHWPEVTTNNIVWTIVSIYLGLFRGHVCREILQSLGGQTWPVTFLLFSRRSSYETIMPVPLMPECSD